MTFAITVTEAAQQYIQKSLSKNQGAGFRLSVKKTGCSGYSYAPAIIEKINAADTVVNVSDQLSIYVDTAWLDLLQGLHIDYIEEEKSGLKQKRLVFSNPKEGNRCGCGESFQIKENDAERR